MYRYLSSHPHVFMSVPKEPGYWATDYPSLTRQHFVRLDSHDDYLKLFRDAGPERRVVGEASTAYLSSVDAVPNIVNECPRSRFLILLRHPADFVVSYHNHKVYDFTEDVRDLEAAWRLQEVRAHGRRIPRTCRESRFAKSLISCQLIALCVQHDQIANEMDFKTGSDLANSVILHLRVDEQLVTPNDLVGDARIDA